MFDHIFSRLGIDSDGKVDHPLAITEPLCNPNYCRHRMHWTTFVFCKRVALYNVTLVHFLEMNELLFECYNIPSVFYGVDSLFSLFENQGNFKGLNVNMYMSCSCTCIEFCLFAQK